MLGTARTHLNRSRGRGKDLKTEWKRRMERELLYMGWEEGLEGGRAMGRESSTVRVATYFL